MGKSKGVVHTATRMFAERRFGKAAVADCLARLDAQDQVILGDVEPMGWYPLAPMVRFMKVLDQVYGRGDLALCREVGEFSADWQLTRFHKLMLRFAPGDWMVRRGLELWGRYHDSGTWQIEKPAPNAIIGRLVGFTVDDVAWCQRVEGFLKKAVLLTGVHEPWIQHPLCLGRGDACCEFSGGWR